MTLRFNAFMPNTELKIGHLDESKHGSKKNITAIVFLFEKREGFIFAVVDIRGESKEAKQISKIVADNVENVSASVDENSNFQHVFEQMLTNINKEIEQESERKGWKTAPEDFNALIGIVSKERMYLSGAGDMVAIYLHRKDKTRYKIYNLFRGIQTGRSALSWKKILSVVLDGDLHPGDIFLAANRELAKEIPKDDILNIVSTLPPTGAVVKMRQYFPLKTDFGVVVVKAQGNLKATTEEPSATNSIENLGKTTSETQRILEDQKPDVKKLSVIIGLIFGLLKILIAAALVTFSLLLGLIHYFYKLALTLKNTDHKKTIKLTRSRTDAWVNSLLIKFNVLPKTSKYILLAILVLIFILVLSIMFISRAKVKERETEAYNASIQVVEEKRDAALASVIYHDENQARELLLEAMNLIERLNTETDERKAKQEILRTEIEDALDDLRHIEKIDEPTVLANLREVEAEANAESIALATNGLFVLTDNQKAYLVDQNSKSLEAIEIGESDAGIPVATGYDDTNNVIYFLDERPGISMFDPDQNILSSVVIGLVPGIIPDIEVYARRIYAISPTTEQIIRYSRAGSGFDNGSAWITSKTASLTDAVSITIDGDIYILKADGAIIKFSNNQEVGWNLGIIDPALAGATFIWTDDDSKYLYVLEPVGKRVVVIEKESGSLVVQYYSENFSDLKDFVIDEESKKIYLLAGTQILAIDATHLK